MSGVSPEYRNETEKPFPFFTGPEKVSFTWFLFGIGEIPVLIPPKEIDKRFPGILKSIDDRQYAGSGKDTTTSEEQAMVTLLMVVYGSVIALVTVWTILMFRSNRHFRSAIQHPSLTHHIRF